MADKNFHGNTEFVGYVYVSIVLIIIFSLVLFG